MASNSAHLDGVRRAPRVLGVHGELDLARGALAESAAQLYTQAAAAGQARRERASGGRQSRASLFVSQEARVRSAAFFSSLSAAAARAPLPRPRRARAHLKAAKPCDLPLARLLASHLPGRVLAPRPLTPQTVNQAMID